ncbi:MAG: HlyC/CorC family transporter [Methanomicrobium sp.]|uniref:hemolysin family protein n=1 Tax=Methanomicrobium mobile TaxID=2205 RepID=UPI0005B29EB6|nr:hemolysin family protein [Methanomicrobium mobile]MBP5083259.1 HlyC/CorC family transporter [Methanomicrobium sp.]MBP5475277.1 HlyC/CorC family transporter [Methanomicrobium sp.]
MPNAVEITLIILLIAFNALFAMAEFAIISSKSTRLKKLIEEGNSGAEAALKLSEDSTKFLSTIQIGITLIGILTGAIGGLAASGPLARYLAQFPQIAPYSSGIAVLISVAIITYFMLIFGELIPKKIALNNTEKIAAGIARPMQFFALIATPFTFIISASTDIILRIFGLDREKNKAITEEEIIDLIEEGTDNGAIEKSEQEMVENIFDLDDLRLGSLMIPRPDIIAINIDDSKEEIRKVITENPRSIFPVYRGNLDNLLGIIQVKDLWTHSCDLTLDSISGILKKPIFVPSSLTASELLEEFKRNKGHFALVSDEYGGIAGLVTLHDILEAIVGDIHCDDEPEDVQAVQREDGSWLIDGNMLIGDFKEHFGIDGMPQENQGQYHTIAGFIMMQLQKIPKEGDSFNWNGYRFEVTNMDVHRIDKVLVAVVKKDRNDEKRE